MWFRKIFCYKGRSLGRYIVMRECGLGRYFVMRKYGLERQFVITDVVKKDSLSYGAWFRQSNG